MKALVVLAHPEPQSFNGALFRQAQQSLEAAGYEVMVSDLYRMGFDPVSDRHNFTTAKDADFLKLQLEEVNANEQGGFVSELAAEMEKVEAADLVIFQFPLWWFGLPAILKGWFDRVFAMGWAYGGGHIYETGMFRGKRAMLSLTTGAPESGYRTDGFNGDIEAILRPIHRGILEFTGFSVLAPAIHYGPVRVSPEERQAWLEDWDARLRQIAHEAPIQVGRY